MAGLGNFDVVVHTSVLGSAVYTCQNQGGNQAPGQNKVLVGPATSTTSIPASEIKNGNLTFTTNPAVLTAPATVSGTTAGCPNPNWTGVNPVLTVTSISLTIEQPPGTTIFTCGASDPLSGTVALTC
jgi:phosphohistidine swiveling domain-containing protein